MPRPKRITSSYKLLVASIGVASVTYSSCGMQVANLVACPPDQCPPGNSVTGSGAGGGAGGSPADGGTDGAVIGNGGAGGH